MAEVYILRVGRGEERQQVHLLIGSAPAQHRLSIGSAPAQHRLSIGSASAQHRLSIGSAPAQHRRSTCVLDAVDTGVHRWTDLTNPIHN